MLAVGVALVAFVATLNWPLDAPSPVPAPRLSASLQPVQDRLAAEPPPRLVCEVARITDGDTLRCADGTRIRLHAVAAREADETCSPGHPCPAASGVAATRALERLAAGKTLSCEPTGRSYARITAICWTAQGEEINCSMVRSGTAVLWPRFNRETPICRL